MCSPIRAPGWLPSYWGISALLVVGVTGCSSSSDEPPTQVARTTHAIVGLTFPRSAQELADELSLRASDATALNELMFVLREDRDRASTLLLEGVTRRIIDSSRIRRAALGVLGQLGRADRVPDLLVLVEHCIRESVSPPLPPPASDCTERDDHRPECYHRHGEFADPPAEELEQIAAMQAIDAILDRTLAPDLTHRFRVALRNRMRASCAVSVAAAAVAIELRHSDDPSTLRGSLREVLGPRAYLADMELLTPQEAWDREARR